MTKDTLQYVIDTYENGNKTEAKMYIKRMSKKDIVNLISMWQPYHATIARLQIWFEDKQI